VHSRLASRLGFSHVYFFASPPISRSAGRWNEPLFQRFTQVYVTAFATPRRSGAGARANQDAVVRFLYPSSVFVTQPEQDSRNMP